jgi:hypothetical protein
VRLVEEGALRPLVELVRFPDAQVQRCASVAINAVALGEQVRGGEMMWSKAEFYAQPD